jgi:TorA maturation chaperone TorD
VIKESLMTMPNANRNLHGQDGPSISTSEDATARSGMYRLLARLWLGEADRGLVKELRTPPLREAFSQAGGILPPDDQGHTVEQLAIEYCRLFVGPMDHLPPYQSVWQSGQFHDAATASMEEFIEIVGYDTNALPRGMMFDHLGLQLDVMGHILDKRSVAPCDTELLRIILEIEQSFFASHLLWPAELLEAAARIATTGFYRSVIKMTRDFLNAETNERLLEIRNAGSPGALG